MSIECPKCQTNNPDTVKFCGECGTPLELDVVHTKTLETPTEELTRGSVFAGRYEIIEELGKGGMGKVYRVLDTKLNEEVALKLIKPEIASDKKTVERFRNELKTARKIVQKNVGRMFDLNEEKDTHYITMEYVPGQDLKGLIRQSGRLAIPTAISIAKQVCEGLAEAHRIGVIHRDLKPSNIMIDKEGNARIMDFGIARTMKGKGITGAGVMIGTPEYMSPEQVEGKETDKRSDIYSLGIILYEMLTGQLPFEGDSPLSIAMKHKGEAPKDPKELNPQIHDVLCQLILKCLEKDRKQRYPGAEELCTDLDRIEKDMPAAVRAVPRRKPFTSKEITVSFNLKRILIPAVALLAVASLIILLFKNRGMDLDPNRIIVAVFENKTGDVSLDSIGNRVSNSIAQGISEVGIRTSMPEITSIMSPYKAGSESEEIENAAQLRAVAEKKGAGIAVTGSYYIQGEILQFQTKLTDMIEKKPLYSLPPVSGPKDNPDKVIEELKQRIMSVVPTHFYSYTWGGLLTRPPIFEAFHKFTLGMDCYGISDFDKAILHFKSALEIDPDYMRARMQIAMAYGTMGEIDKALAALKPLLENREKLTRYERLTLSWCEYWLQGNNAEALRMLRELEKLAPADVFTLFLIGAEEFLLNRPQGTVDTFAKINPKIMYREMIGSAWILPLLASAHHLLGNFKMELKEVRRGLKYFPNLSKLKRSEICALAALGRINEVKKALAESAATQRQIQEDNRLVAALELRAHGHKEAAMEVVNRAVEWYKIKSSQADFRYNLAQAFYLAERWDEAQALFEELNLEKSDNIHYMGYLGALAARRKDREGAHRISTELQELEKLHGRYTLYGRHTYWQARIASLIGEHHQAVELLRAALAQGFDFGLHIHRNMDFEPLRDYPPFQQLIRPRE